MKADTGRKPEGKHAVQWWGGNEALNLENSPETKSHRHPNPPLQLEGWYLLPQGSVKKRFQGGIFISFMQN